MSSDQQLQIIDAPFDNMDAVAYAMNVRCDAWALNEHGQHGRFAYIDLINDVPGQTLPEYQNIDIAAWCEARSADTDAWPTFDEYDSQGMGGAEGADSTDGASSGGGGGSETGTSPPQAVPGIPPSCDFAERSRAIRGPNNEITWRKDSLAAVWDRNAFYPADTITGGLAYTVLPCGESPGVNCIRLDELLIISGDASLGTTVRVGLRNESSLVELSPSGTFTISAGKLELLVHSTWGDRESLHSASNPEDVIGHISLSQRTLTLDHVASSPTAEYGAEFALIGDIVNTQPRSSIATIWNPTTGRVTLSALSADAEGDTITHQWVIPGVGEWLGAQIELPTPRTPIPVMLFIRDSHGATSASATWLGGPGL